MITIEHKADCTGCGACRSVCPKSCISMLQDEEGFFYPSVDKSKCVNCGMCERICPTKQNTYDAKIICAYAVKNTNNGIRLASSSGGVFSALAANVLEKGGTVYGVRFSEDFKEVKFCEITDIDDVDKLRGSKYIQATPHSFFSSIKDKIINNELVLFSGTPCQVNALKNYVGKDSNNLLCVDIICHGVPSPLLWKSYLNEFEKKHRGTIVDVNFRHKRRGWHEFGTQVSSVNRKYYCSKDMNPYMQMFLKNYCLRPSCYDCKAKKMKSADITLGDFWGIKSISPEFDDNMGVSLVLIRSEKGEHLFHQVNSLNMVEVDPNTALQSNASEYASATKPKERESFYTDLIKYSFKQLRIKYGRPNYTEIIKKELVKSPIWQMYKKKYEGGGNHNGTI